jgi:HD-like signal output (HDOD) protein
MPSPTSIALLLAVTATVGGIVAHVFRRQAVKPASTRANEGVAGQIPIAEKDAPVPYATEATEDVAAHCLKLAFGVSRFDYQIFAEHAVVLQLVEKSLGNAAEQQQYFPRRPLLLPKLLQALNDTDSTRQALVQLLLEDPTLAGTTLKRANNAFYRMKAQPVESLDRAVALLGTDGLRRLASSAILQPVFRLPKGFFDRFADIAWEHAQRSAASAQAFAISTNSDDPFVAQLLGVLRSVATLMLFRLTLDKYRERPSVLPRPEVFIKILQTHQNAVAVQIAKTWQLSDMSLHALEEQSRAISPTHMTPLGQAVYFGELAASLAIAIHYELYSVEGAHAVLLAQGLTPERMAVVLQAAEGADLEI